MKFAKQISTWVYALAELISPRRCVVCGDLLEDYEEGLCLACNINLPRTHYHLLADNPLHNLLVNRFPLVRATAYMFYRPGSPHAQLVRKLKYRGRSDLGVLLGRYAATEIGPSGFFEGVDVILPVPLHVRKLRKRGYNQSLMLAQGLSAITGLPISQGVARTRWTDSQTHKSYSARQEILKGVFSLVRPDELHGKHVLVVDDVITTGATITACSRAACEAGDVRISIFCLADAMG